MDDDLQGRFDQLLAFYLRWRTGEFSDAEYQMAYNRLVPDIHTKEAMINMLEERASEVLRKEMEKPQA